MKYFKVFNNESEYTAYIASEDCVLPNVSTLRDCTNTWINPITRDYSKEYFTIESLEDDNTITLTRYSTGGGHMGTYVLSVSTDDGSTWTEVTVPQDDQAYTLATLDRGEKALFKYVSGRLTLDVNSRGAFGSDGRFNVYGNAMSLRTVDFTGDTSTKIACRLFKGSKVVSARNLVLPSASMGNYGYHGMFCDCTYLTDAPALPATTLAGECYSSMFENCPSLTAAPELPAMSLADKCYTYMFKGCTSLVATPNLPATTMPNGSCYKGMFSGCTSLTTVPSSLPPTTVPSGCYQDMFSDCTSLTTVPSDFLPATTVGDSGYRSMFCRTSITVAPNLPATTLGVQCYRYMFGECKSLTTAPATLPALTAVGEAYYSMFYLCTSLTVTPEIMATTVGSKGCHSMFKGCSGLTTASDMHAASVASESFVGAFSGCTNLVNVQPTLSATTLDTYCYQQMYQDCTSLTTAPNLPATTLAGSCYNAMFYNCTSLTVAPRISATTTVGTSSCKLMFTNCTSLTTTQPVLSAATIGQEGYYGMFYNCTSLTAAPVVCATTVGTSSCKQMFFGCSGITTAQDVLPALTLANSSYYSMYEKCTSLVTAPIICATTVDSESCRSMFYQCSSLTTGPSKLPATTLADKCYQTMFLGCTNLTTAPELPALTLASECYRTMFSGCNKLNYIKCLATDISASNCTSAWVQNVASSGTFVKSSEITEQTWGRGGSGIPTNWVVYDDTHVSVTGVTLNTATATVDKGDTYTLTATVLPVNASVQTVTWSTSDSSVATVVDGVVTGVGCGNATITVTTTEGSYTAQCSVTVENHVTSVDLNTYVVTIHSGHTYQLIETVSPSDACDKSVTWSTSNSSVASVDTNGLVSGVTTGSATVTVTTVDGGFSKNCSVTVDEGEHASAVTLSSTAMTVAVNGTQTLTATVLPPDAFNKNVTWSSSDSTIATVDSSGVVSGVASGNTIVTVTTVDGGHTAQCSVTVAEVSFETMTIEGASSVSAETCAYVAICDNVEDVTSSATWSITAGSQYATINSNNGVVTILNGANESSVTIQAIYVGLTATTTATLTYLAGATSETTSEITTDIGGNVTSVVTTVTEYGDGSSTEVVETIVTDVNGDLVGSTESTTTTNADGSYNGVTTNYDENGDSVNGSNVTGDTEGNVSTQTVEYDDSGNTTVTGYEIDTSGSESGKTFHSGGTNTEYYAFDLTHGFVLDFDFTIDFSNQPPGQSDNHHNILTAKRADPSPWYGFQIRQSSTNKYIQLGTQFTTGGNTNTTINPSSTTGNVGSYSLRIVYDPNSSGNKFVCTNMVTGNEIYSSTGTFPDLEELKYLRITIGNATDSNGNPFRYSNITVSKFELKKLKYVANPTMTYEYGAITINCSTVGADIYYRLNLSGSYSAYTTPITITADTVVQAYTTYSGDTSDIVREDFEIVDVTGVTLSDNSIAIGQGRTYTLTATVLPSDALDKSVIWSSSDSNVASVDSSGVVSGITTGSATVTVTTHDGGYTAQCSVSVSASPYTELEYIESTSTGGQYIDLDIKLYETLNNWYDIAIKFILIGNGKGGNQQATVFGCQKDAGTWPGTFIRRNSNNVQGRYIGGTAKDNTIGTINSSTPIELPVQTAPNKNVTGLNNGGQTHDWGTSLFCYFSDANNTPGRFSCTRLYYFKLFLKPDASTQGTLVRDMMPCKRNSDNAIGLLDKVNNVFYTNPSGDAFVAGPVVNS